MKHFIYIKLITTIILVFTIYNADGQEIPPLVKFTPENYGGDKQNWSISQSSNKFIYVANNEGLLEYNGAKWTIFPSPNKTIIRAVLVVGEKIYTGCYMEFGFWEKDKFGKLQYTSLVPKLKEPMIEDEHIWNIITYDQWIVFQTHNRIYFYNTDNEKYTIINSNNIITKIFNVENVIYYHVSNEGVYKIEEGKSKLILEAPMFKDDRVINIFSTQEGQLIQTRESGFYTLINDNVSLWQIPAKDTLQNINVFNSIQLQDKSFILGTIKKGVIYLSKDGEIEYRIDRSNGLSNNTALCLFEDKDNNIWVGLDNGIDCINIKSPISVFNDDKGNIGTVYASTVFNNILYLGTNQGLFYKKAEGQESFKFIEGTAGQVWSLFSFNDELFCGHHSGIFIVNNTTARQISNEPGTWGFRPIPNKKNELLFGNYGGLNVLSKNQGIWKLKNKIQGFNSSARHFEIGKDNDVFISHGYKGLFRLTLNKDFTLVKNLFLDSSIPIGNNSSLIKYKERILYTFEGGIMAYDDFKSRFIKDSILSPLITDLQYTTGKLVVDKTQKLWSFSEDNISYVSSNPITNEFKINRIAIPSRLRKGQIGYENISLVENNKYLLGLTDGYITIDISQFNQQTNESEIELNSISLRDVDANNTNVNLNDFGDFDYSYNTVAFNYSVPEYNKYEIVKYQYKLVGRYNKWSDWIETSEIIFENLSFGNYSFIVRAKIGNKLTNNTISYDFKINRPWYLSNVALLLYLFSLFTISFIIHKAYKNYYKKQHEHKYLEREQLIIRIKNEKLNEAIENKNRELAISTMSIIKKNEVLSSIKKELKNTKKPNNESVIKLIDSNINNNKDWKFLEEAFNNVDKDFLDKVKNAYPEMTPNDLRFCAYLRLNLTSKEIAPLLNISVRSVETRRYRLRKRMNLPHDTSLTDHILKI
ncbi:helix-turn-helix and ligand-binding sensor domain-containing protein [Changchengzhania lutea]|uniref:helix-turn-helix and ligand-binding sensor domain-containing protein n=1 Tax=Changchengzhania lutea TaxID=2049305 RepID=UPI00115D27E4|nr:two-component regulator propeller domain-containing protein [Changchengzhania lutea]